MPKWIKNELHIWGKKQALGEIRYVLGPPRQPIIFENILPKLEEIKGKLRLGPGEFPRWHGWQCEDSKIVEVSNEHIAFKFFTAFSPPIPVIQKFSESYPTLAFKLCHVDDVGCRAGSCFIQRGKITREDNNYGFDEQFNYTIGEMP